MKAATAVARPKKPQQKPSVAYIQIKFKDNDNPKGFKVSDLDGAVKRMERYLSKVKGKWSWAVLRMKGTNEIVHYYHPSKETQRLTVQDYKEILLEQRIGIYIIYNQAWRKRNKTQKGVSKYISNLDEVRSHYNHEVQRIDIYKDGKLINQFKNNKFLR